MVRLHQEGILEHLRRKYFRFLKETECPPDFRIGSSKLGLHDVWSLFAVGAAGLGLATVVIVLELLYIKYRQNETASKIFWPRKRYAPTQGRF